jgi:F-type H+-transporting ATPase subunit epsilon
LVVDAPNVEQVRAEDETGSFGIRRGHTEFVTVLTISVISYHDTSGIERHVAIRGGVMRVRAGELVDVATREAIVGDDLAELRHAVLDRFHDKAEAEAKARTRAAQLNMAVVRNLYRYVRGERDGRGLGLGGPRGGQS